MMAWASAILVHSCPKQEVLEAFSHGPGLDRFFVVGARLGRGPRQGLSELPMFLRWSDTPANFFRIDEPSRNRTVNLLIKSQVIGATYSGVNNTGNAPNHYPEMF